MRLICSLLSFVVVLICTTGATAATLRATYLFNDTLAAQESTAPALVAVDPLGLNSFENAIVYDQPRRVYHWDGNVSPSPQQAGLSLDTTGLIPTNNYSVEMVFAFLERDNNHRRILDVQNRTSDSGFYVNSSDHLAVLHLSPRGSTVWTNNVFHHVVLTNASTSTVKGYLDGVLEFTLSTSVMNIQNPGDLLHFFLDNTSDSFQSDFSDGRVALIRVYQGILTDSEVSQLAQNPFAAATGPSLTLALTGCTTCRAGDTFRVTARVQNPASTPIRVEVKAGVVLPNGSEVNVWVVPDRHFEVTLPAGLDTTVELLSVTLPSGLPPGGWSYEGVLLSPELGRTLARGTHAFTVQ